MLAPWLELPGAHDRVASWSDAVGLDLARLGTTGTDAQIRDTALAQPLLTAVALLSAEALLDARRPDAVCGHSVGELAALAVAGVLDPTSAVRLATQRGRAMAAAAAGRHTGMSAVLGGAFDDVTAAASAHGLEVATVNGRGQVVLGGPVEGLDALAAEPPRGARVRRLDVAGAFHTAAMRPAVAAFERQVSALDLHDAACPVVADADGAALTSAADLAPRLVAQLTAPVRFDRCLDRLDALGVTALVELAPGGTLTALAARALPAVPAVALRSPEDLAAARALVAEHAGDRVAL
jgi:[acyl-carrier-protein] S-malonyltransferase